MASKEFLEEMWQQAKKHLPGWLYASLVQNARPKAGGKAAHRDNQPGALEKIALSRLDSKELKGLTDDALLEVRGQLLSWTKTAERKKESLEPFINAGLICIEEIKSRGGALQKRAKIEGACDDEEEKVKKSEAYLKGPNHALVAFVGASPSEMDKARQAPLTGAIGETFNKQYLDPLGLVREEVLILNGTDKDWIEKQLDSKVPFVVVALGKETKEILGERAFLSLPHPAVIQKHRDSGEVARKLVRIRNRIDQIQKDLSNDGGMRSLRAADFWESSWHKQLPGTGEGKFALQAHGPKHCDLRFTGKSELWGWSMFAKSIGDSPIEVAPKAPHSNLWLDIADKTSFLSKAKNTSNDWEIHDLLDKGTYQLGVVTKDKMEIILDGAVLNGQYYIERAPLNGRRRWLIYKSDGGSIADRRTLADFISESRTKNHDIILWARPGDTPRLIDVRQGKEILKAVNVVKADTSKHIVYGAVMDPYGKTGPKPDAHNDWTPPADIEAAAHDFMQNSRVIGLQHKGKANAYPVESWVESYPPGEYKKAMRKLPHKIYKRQFGTDALHSGSWVMGVKLGPKEWQMYLDGELNAFSPGGTGIRRPMSVEEMPEVKIIELVEKPN